MSKFNIFKKREKEVKPVVMLISENTNDLFVDVEHLQEWRKERPLNEYYYGGLVLGFGKNVFVFDLKSCEFFMYVHNAGEEPKMAACEYVEER